MKTRRMLWIAACTSLALLASGGPARAQDPGDEAFGPGRGGAMERRMEMREHRMDMMRDLDLSKEQRDRIAELRDKHQRSMIRMRADLETADLDLRKLVRAEKPDRQAINRQVDRIVQMRGEVQKASIGLRLDIASVLTPEQREKMRSGMRERGES